MLYNCVQRDRFDHHTSAQVDDMTMHSTPRFCLTARGTYSINVYVPRESATQGTISTEFVQKILHLRSCILAYRRCQCTLPAHVVFKPSHSKGSALAELNPSLARIHTAGSFRHGVVKS
jgi:hypothetical protein